jgi:hypothetical protein
MTNVQIVNLSDAKMLKILDTLTLAAHAMYMASASLAATHRFGEGEPLSVFSEPEPVDVELAQNKAQHPRHTAANIDSLLKGMAIETNRLNRYAEKHEKHRLEA